MKNFNFEEFTKKLERKRNGILTKFLGIFSKNIFEISAEILIKSFGLPEEKKTAAANYLASCHFYERPRGQGIADERKFLGVIMPELSALSDEDVNILRDIYKKILKKYKILS